MLPLQGCKLDTKVRLVIATCSSNMATDEFDPGEVISLLSSDIEDAPTSKKRSLGDASDSGQSINDSSSAHKSKRVRTAAPSTSNTEPVEVRDESADEGEIQEESRGTAARSSANTSSSSSSEQTGSEEQKSKPNSQKSPGGTGGADAEITFQLGELELRLPTITGKRDDSWLDRFNEWVRAFEALNVDNTRAITPTVAQSAYAHYIDNYSGLKPKKRRSAKQVATEIESTGGLAALLQSLRPVQSSLTQYANAARKAKSSRASSLGENGTVEGADEQASDSETEFEPTWNRKESHAEAAPNDCKINHPAKRPHGSSSNSVIMTERNVPTGPDALEQQRRYFPSASDHTKMCILCGRDTHLAANCPTLVCSLCNSLEHSDLCCPSRERCHKCRQMGHRAAQCTEKLALTKDEGLACSICDSSDHLEKDCTQVWRSFHPDAVTINKVSFMPASCSMCGSGTHYSADCNRRRGDAQNPTWSLKNAGQYVDPDCEAVTIEEAAGEPRSTRSARAPELQIRGHASRTNNVHYSSDDSDVEFLGNKPVRRPAPVGHIRMASNIQMPQSAAPRGDRGSRGGRQNGNSFQPPLPPGPPPPGPPNRRPHPSGTSSGSHSLPSKPPTKDFRNMPPPAQMQGSRGHPQNNNASFHSSNRGGQRGGGRGGHGGRGGRGGRGGGGGGGRGRGRGRGK